MSAAPQITLRPFRESDAGFFVELATDPQVTRFVGNGRPWSPEAARKRARAALCLVPARELGAIRWFVAEDLAGPVGILVSSRSEQGVEIGYWVAPARWGRGIAGAMVDRALEIIPCVYDTNCLLARVAPGNAASARVLTRRGLRYQALEEGLELYVSQQPPAVTAKVPGAAYDAGN